MPTENTYQSIPSLRKIEIEYLAWQITRMQAGIREFIGQKEAHLRFGRQNVERWVSEGRLQRTSDRAKSSTGWKTCISAHWIHTTIK